MSGCGHQLVRYRTLGGGLLLIKNGHSYWEHIGLYLTQVNPRYGAFVTISSQASEDTAKRF